MTTKSFQAAFLALLMAIVASGCRGKVVLRLPSPSGTQVAIVRDLPSIDPPTHVIYMESAQGEDEKELLRLAPDNEWVGEGFWSSDGQRAGFLICGRRFVVFEADSLRQVVDMDLLAEHPGLPYGMIARHAAFSDDGSSVEFSICPESGPGPCGARQSTPL